MPEFSTPDPHPRWLKELRALNVNVGSAPSDGLPGTVPVLQAKMNRLRDQMIDTEPTTRDGVVALVSLLGDLAWSDPTRRLARTLLRSLDKFWST